MDNILNYPTSTHVDRLVPKTAFYKHLEINTRLKMRFVEDVERIQWLYKLAPSTMNVDTGKTVHEIVMFLVTLKAEDMPDDVFLAIDRQMPRHVVFVLQYANRGRLLLNYKEWVDANKTRFNILKTFRTEWMPLAKVKLELAGSSLDNIYEAFAGQISGLVRPMPLTRSRLWHCKMNWLVNDGQRKPCRSVYGMKGSLPNRWNSTVKPVP